jgi:hypothetical protein
VQRRRTIIWSAPESELGLIFRPCIWVSTRLHAPTSLWTTYVGTLCTIDGLLRAKSSASHGHPSCRDYLPTTRPCTRPGPLNPSMEERCEGRWFTTFGAGPFHSHHDLAMRLDRKLSIARRGASGMKPSVRNYLPPCLHSPESCSKEFYT